MFHGHGKDKGAEKGHSMGHGHGHGHGMGHGHGHGMGHGHGHGHGAEGGSVAVDTDSSRGGNKGYVLIAVIYLLGLTMGALDMSIVNPARTVIQNGMGVEDSLGVWILTIYTLAYAASIPVMGKLADRHGRKYIYILCIFLFGFGSLMCGLSREVNSFEMLLVARVIQALGGGGIMPVATAEFGTAFPEEKRGMALGIVGMVYGVASIFGPSAGSLILDIFGQTQWQFIFYINIPICLFIVIFGLMKLPNSKMDDVKPIDGLGIMLLTAMTLSLMYGLKQVDFFEFVESVSSMDCWPYLLASVVILPLFIIRERFAADPIINLRYFKNLNIVITLVCALISGVIMMGTIFYPQFSENAMFMKSGAGGYFIALLGLGSAVGAMGSGKLIDKYGIKPVLGAGFVGAAIGSFFMAFVACQYPNIVTVCLTMILAGTGLGFTMGTPLNYMMLQNTDEAESNSALATMSLIRSIGTAVTPAIMVAFLVHAGVSMQDNLMEAMPEEVTVSSLPYAAELDKKLDDLRKDEDTKDMLKDIDIPTLSDFTTFTVNMNETDGDFDVEISDELLEKMENSDVTNITDVCKEMAVEVFEQVKPDLSKEATDGIQKGIDSMKDKTGEMKDGIEEMSDGVSELNASITKMGNSINTMSKKISNSKSEKASMSKAIKKMEKAVKGIQKGIDGMNQGINALEAQIASMAEDDPRLPAMKEKLADLKKQKADAVADKKKMKKTIAKMKKGKAGISKGITGMTTAKNKMVKAKAEMIDGRAELKESRAELQDAYDEMLATIKQLKAVKKAIPAMFDEAQENYLKAIDDGAEEIQATYQRTLNGGFKDMAIFVAFVALLGALILIPYKDKRSLGKRHEAEEE